MDTKTATAAKVAAAVEKAGITRRDLSNATGIAYTTLYRKLHGHVPFNVDDIDSVAKALRVKPASLVEFAEVAA